MLMVRTDFWSDDQPWLTEFFSHSDPAVLEEFQKKATGLAESDCWGICGEESTLQSLTLDGARPGDQDNTRWLWTQLQN